MVIIIYKTCNDYAIIIKFVCINASNINKLVIAKMIKVTFFTTPSPNFIVDSLLFIIHLNISSLQNLHAMI